MGRSVISPGWTGRLVTGHSARIRFLARTVAVPTGRPHRTGGARAVRGVHSMASSRQRTERGGRGNGGRGKGRGEHLARTRSQRGGPAGTAMGADERETAGSLSGFGVGNRERGV